MGCCFSKELNPNLVSERTSLLRTPVPESSPVQDVKQYSVTEPTEEKLAGLAKLGRTNPALDIRSNDSSTSLSASHSSVNKASSNVQDGTDVSQLDRVLKPDGSQECLLKRSNVDPGDAVKSLQNPETALLNSVKQKIAENAARRATWFREVESPCLESVAASGKGQHLSDGIKSTPDVTFEKCGQVHRAGPEFLSTLEVATCSPDHEPDLDDLNFELLTEQSFKRRTQSFYSICSIDADDLGSEPEPAVFDHTFALANNEVGRVSHSQIIADSKPSSGTKNILYNVQTRREDETCSGSIGDPNLPDLLETFCLYPKGKNALSEKFIPLLVEDVPEPGKMSRITSSDVALDEAVPDLLGRSGPSCSVQSAHCICFLANKANGETCMSHVCGGNLSETPKTISKSVHPGSIPAGERVEPEQDEICRFLVEPEAVECLSKTAVQKTTSLENTHAVELEVSSVKSACMSPVSEVNTPEVVCEVYISEPPEQLSESISSGSTFAGEPAQEQLCHSLVEPEIDFGLFEAKTSVHKVTSIPEVELHVPYEVSCAKSGWSEVPQEQSNNCLLAINTDMSHSSGVNNPEVVGVKVPLYETPKDLLDVPIGFISGRKQVESEQQRVCGSLLEPENRDQLSNTSLRHILEVKPNISFLASNETLVDSSYDPGVPEDASEISKTSKQFTESSSLGIKDAAKTPDIEENIFHHVESAGLDQIVTEEASSFLNVLTTEPTILPVSVPNIQDERLPSLEALQKQSNQLIDALNKLAQNQSSSEALKQSCQGSTPASNSRDAPALHVNLETCLTSAEDGVSETNPSDSDANKKVVSAEVDPQSEPKTTQESLFMPDRPERTGDLFHQETSRAVLVNSASDTIPTLSHNAEGRTGRITCNISCTDLLEVAAESDLVNQKEMVKRRDDDHEHDLLQDLYHSEDLNTELNKYFPDLKVLTDPPVAPEDFCAVAARNQKCAVRKTPDGPGVIGDRQIKLALPYSAVESSTQDEDGSHLKKVTILSVSESHKVPTLEGFDMFSPSILCVKSQETEEHPHLVFFKSNSPEDPANPLRSEGDVDAVDSICESAISANLPCPIELPDTFGSAALSKKSLQSKTDLLVPLVFNNDQQTPDDLHYLSNADNQDPELKPADLPAMCSIGITQEEILDYHIPLVSAIRPPCDIGDPLHASEGHCVTGDTADFVTSRLQAYQLDSLDPTIAALGTPRIYPMTNYGALHNGLDETAFLNMKAIPLPVEPAQVDLYASTPSYEIHCLEAGAVPVFQSVSQTSESEREQGVINMVSELLGKSDTNEDKDCSHYLSMWPGKTDQLALDSTWQYQFPEKDDEDPQADGKSVPSSDSDAVQAYMPAYPCNLLVPDGSCVWDWKDTYDIVSPWCGKKG